MKLYLYPPKYINKHGLTACTFAVASLASLYSFSQTPVPELVFKNSQLQTGPGTKAAGADGAVYMFSHVTSAVDAKITINGRSSSKVSLSSIDLIGPDQDPTAGTGYDNAWQPRVSYNGGSAPANQSWWMEFQVSFLQHDDHASPAAVSDFVVTALDVDGDGMNLHEFISFYAQKTYTLEQNTLMTCTSLMGCLYDLSSAGKQFDGPAKNYKDITPTATDVMVSNHYQNTNNFVVRIGARSGNTASNSADRMNSLWFKDFQFNLPVVSPLPLSLLNFTARLSNNKVALNWSTQMEVNSSHFTIQRSTDGKSFDDDGIIFTDGDSRPKKEYNFSDNVQGLNSREIYYRLKMVDLDAKYRYSEVVMVRMMDEKEQVGLSIFPNPVSNELRVTIPASWQSKTISYNVYNTAGTLMKQKISNNAGQTETLQVADLPTGIYFVKTANGNETAVQKFMKSH